MPPVTASISTQWLRHVSQPLEAVSLMVVQATQHELYSIKS